MLFEKTRISNMVLDNRLVMPPLETNLANKDGSVSQRLINHYARIARGGPGLIVVEATSMDPVHSHPTQLNISNDKLIGGLTRLARAIKQYDVKAAIQIQHPGRQAWGIPVQAVAPSPLACRTAPNIPRELSTAEVEDLVERYAEAVVRAREAGFDAVQFHGAHGYLIAQFMSAWSNIRSDKYGGDVYGRATFPLEIIRRTRQKVGRDYPLIFRFSADEYVTGGRKIDESKIIAQLVEKEGIDAISVSAGVFDSAEWTIAPMLLPQGCLVPLAAEIKNVVSVPVVAVGRIRSPRLAEEIIRTGKADFVAMGRPLFADPDLPMKFKEGRFREVRQCISCNTCTQVMTEAIPVHCLVNPDLGREGEEEVRAPRARNILVINGGPVGVEAARVAALRGHSVKLWDKRRSLGGRWSWFLKPYLVNRLKILEELGVEIELGKVITPEAVANEKPDVVIAGRGLSATYAAIPGLENVPSIEADDILDGNVTAKDKTVVLGGGNIGFEVANFLVRQGSQVQVIEEGPTLGHGIEPMTRKILRRQLVERGIVMHRLARVTRVEAGILTFVDEQSTEQCLPFDHLVLAYNREPNEEMIGLLRGGNYELIPAGAYQQPGEYVRAFDEGTAIGRAI